ncbi:hypothetical protein GLOTRDRAFT_118914 [Gloeophyllum trabeum ATCC 11539]|uniref:DUF7726 domain-containing protein n=1 Tax=Gloeophyllum trabeum (strain ATCC 11539 / FP-39264 / Madison 617) TaxID=670483 RepID=S7S0F5_GLOTA|nr:uncharacterized protein GLOTRDRAFT_118914 [Gloeophyllum trabeum ATCC 11539]EPQ60830.1 hypothetical protein GLOTRDRAFT_118914 [Gloeophyllum trabeum ATCC 11539]
MAPKRKSDTQDLPEVAVFADSSLPNQDAAVAEAGPSAPAKKKARSGVAAETSKGKAKEDAPKKPTRWQDVVLEGEDDEDGVPIYDDCNDIRRKIRALQKTPGFKITAWLREIGNINSNSYGRFMKATGPTGGAENGTYVAAYKYFEKIRILEGKKKTPKRLRTEQELPQGYDLVDRKRMWVFMPA